MVGGTGALPAIAKLREATDEAKQKAEGDGATGAASSPLVFLIDLLSATIAFFCNPGSLKRVLH
jgi:hypothetical protein